MNTLISLLIAVLVLWGIWWVLQQLKLPVPFRTIATVIFAIIAILVLVSFLPLGPRFWQ
jgi:heme A synthase